jgi:hypothetical protein
MVRGGVVRMRKISHGAPDSDCICFVVFVKQLGTNQLKPFFFEYEWASLEFAAETGGVLFRK